MDMDQIQEEEEKTIVCPNCGRKMRLNYFLWDRPKYVCESYRQDSDCQMIIMCRDSA